MYTEKTHEIRGKKPTVRKGHRHQARDGHEPGGRQHTGQGHYEFGHDAGYACRNETQERGQGEGHRQGGQRVAGQGIARCSNDFTARAQHRDDWISSLPLLDAALDQAREYFFT